MTDRPSTSNPDGQGQDPALRSSLRVILVAWVFGSIWMWTTAGAAMTRFAREVGTPDFGFGLLAALPHIGALAQLPAAWLLDRFARRKAVFIVAMTFSRLTWAVMAALPWVLPWVGIEAGDGQWWWMSMAGAILLAWVTHNIAHPAWMSWMADVIPRQVRGRFFSFRSLVTQPLGLLLTLGIGYALDIAARADAAAGGLGEAAEAGGAGGGASTMLRVTSIVLVIGSLMGVLDVQFFNRVPDPGPKHPHESGDFLRKLREPLRDKPFRRYIAFNFTLMLALGYVGQYVWLFVFDVAKMSNGLANLLLLGVPLLIHMGAYPLWGRLIDRLGKKPVLVITSALMVIGPLGWLLVSEHHWFAGYAITCLSAMVYPGLEVANLNIMLDLSAPRHDHAAARTTGGSVYVAVNSLATAAGGILSGLLGAAVATWLSDYRASVVGVVITYHGVLFALSAAIRIVAVGWALSLSEPQAVGTRDAIRYMTAGLYNNVRQAVLMPSRVVGAAMRWAYRVDEAAEERGAETVGED